VAQFLNFHVVWHSEAGLRERAMMLQHAHIDTVLVAHRAIRSNRSILGGCSAGANTSFSLNCLARRRDRSTFGEQPDVRIPPPQC
jgi:hypothetical protein